MGGTMSTWIEEEICTANLGDKRLNKRYGKLLEGFSKSPTESIPTSCKGWNETLAAYRFLNNEKVTFENILSPHKEATCQRIEKEDIILTIQDTTSTDYTTKRVSDKVGHIENSGRRGLLLHPTLALTVDRVCLGVIYAEVWSRDIETIGKKQQRKKLPIEAKESFRWIESYTASCKLSERFPEKTIINIGDRENDIYELFVEATTECNKAEIVLRAAQNRRVITEDKEIGLLWKEIERTKELGNVEMELSKTKDRKARKVKLTVQAKKLTLKAPYRKASTLPEVTITAVLIREKNVPKGLEPVEWLLLTTIDVPGFEEAIKILDYYVCRWQIEIYFRILKSGCKVEELQLEEPERIEVALALYMIIAWRVLFLVMLGRKCPNMPAEAVFDRDEWEVMYLVTKDKKPPQKGPRLNDMIIMIAMYGGYQGRKNDPAPGPQTIWIGLRRLADFVIVYSKMKKLQTYV